MTIRAFVPFPDKRLQTRAAEVGSVDDTVRTLWDDMLETMYAMPGIGLAAPQIGVLQRVIVVDASSSKSEPMRMADPEIISASEAQVDYDEGSPNLPGVHAKISRAKKITVSYLDHHGFRVRHDFEDLWAVSVQHQIDHLNGRMYFDNLSPVKRRMLIARAAKLARKQG